MSADLIKLVYELLPGFVTAWIFYGFTAHPRRDTTERIIQALIFTGIIKLGVLLVGWVFVFIGTHAFSLGHWSDSSRYVWSMIFAVGLGFVVSKAANGDSIHAALRNWPRLKKWQITKKNSFPSEWYSSFQRDDRHVVLELKSKRRLIGWPEEWPNDPTGHFLLTEVGWLLDDGAKVPMPQIHRMVVPASEVMWVEQLTLERERGNTDTIATVQQPLVELHRKSKENADAKPDE